MQSHVVFQQYFLYFVVYSVCGYFAEVIYCSLLQRKLVNRGFLYGPWIPIYGFGGLVIHVATSSMHVAAGNPVVVFFTSMMSASVIEYIGSWWMEKAFGLKLWDYSRHRFNINGRVCLLNSTLFGLGGLALTYGGHSSAAGWVDRLSPQALAWSSNSLLLLFTVDFVCSVYRLKKFREGLAELQRLVEQGKENLELLKTMDRKEVAEMVQKRFAEKALLWKGSFERQSKRLLSKFPTMQGSSLPHMDELLERLKAEDPLKEFKQKVLKHD